MTDSIVKILQERDGLSKEEAQELLEEARQAVREGEDPEEVCADYFGLEPDYIWELF